MPVDYLPERRRDFTGPRHAASTWLAVTGKTPWRQRPIATVLAIVAVSLAVARRTRKIH